MTPAVRYAPTTTPDAARVRSARFGVVGLFFAMGMLLATFLSRLPTIREDLGVGNGELASLIIFGAGGALTGLFFTGWAAARFGTRRLLVWSTVSHAIAFGVVALSTAVGVPFWFAFGHFFVSFSFAFTNVPMNTEAANVARAHGRPIIPQFHAAFSVGMAAALGLGALLSHAGVSVVAHFGAVALVLAVFRLAIIPAAAMDGRPIEAEEGAPIGGPLATAKAEYREPRVLMIGAIVFAGAMTEFSAAQWVAIAGVDDFGQTESIGDLMYWLFVASMVTFRMLGSRLIATFGRVVVLRASAVCIAVGVLAFALAPWDVVVALALVLWGAGAALGIPIGLAAASDDPKRASARVAAVSSFATIAGLMVPQLIGHLADASTVRLALLLVLIAPITTFLLARAVRSEGRVFGRHSPSRSKRRATAAEVRRSEAAQQAASAVEPTSTASAPSAAALD